MSRRAHPPTPTPPHPTSQHLHPDSPPCHTPYAPNTIESGIVCCLPCRGLTQPDMNETAKNLKMVGGQVGVGGRQVHRRAGRWAGRQVVDPHIAHVGRWVGGQMRSTGGFPAGADIGNASCQGSPASPGAAAASGIVPCWPGAVPRGSELGSSVGWLLLQGSPRTPPVAPPHFSLCI